MWNKSLGCFRKILDPCLPYTSCKFSSTCNFITEFNQIKCGIVVVNQLIILNMKNACQYLSVYLYYIHVEHWKKKNYNYKDTLNNILVLLYLEKTTDLSQVTKKLDHRKFYQVHFTYFKHHSPLIIIILPVHINYFFISCLNQKVTIKKEAV